jgi:hypothetical protein
MGAPGKPIAPHGRLAGVTSFPVGVKSFTPQPARTEIRRPLGDQAGADAFATRRRRWDPFVSMIETEWLAPQEARVQPGTEDCPVSNASWVPDGDQDGEESQPSVPVPVGSSVSPDPSPFITWIDPPST